MKDLMLDGRLEFRLPKSEKEEIQSRARQCGMSAGLYLRTLNRRQKPVPYFSDGDRSLVAQMIGLRSDIRNLHNLFGKKITPELETRLMCTLAGINGYLDSLGK